jgi:hypothetical protein
MCDPVYFQSFGDYALHNTKSFGDYALHNTKSFSGLQFDNLKAKIRAEGYDISGEAGELQYKGVTVAWLYNPERQELTLTCTKKPFIYPCGTVNSKLQELVMGGS